MTVILDLIASAASMTNWPSSCGGGVFIYHAGPTMASYDKTLKKREHPGAITEETILKIAKEITVKFIEVGRITPATFELAFKDIYATIDKTVRKD